MARVVRCVVEVGVPDGVTERDLANKLKYVLRWPLQLGAAGDRATLVQAEVKWWSRVLARELKSRGASAPAPVRVQCTSHEETSHD